MRLRCLFLIVGCFVWHVAGAADVAPLKPMRPGQGLGETIWDIEKPVEPVPPAKESAPATAPQRLDRGQRLFSLEDEMEEDRMDAQDAADDDVWETAGQLPGQEDIYPVEDDGDADDTDAEQEADQVGKEKGDEEAIAITLPPVGQETERTLLVNFNDVSITEYLRFISRVSNRNFLFDDEDLQFNVTIVSEEPTSIDNMLTALMQILRVHGLMMIEEGNNLVIHRNPQVKSLARVVTGDGEGEEGEDSEFVTRVFRLNTLSPEHVATMIRPMISETAIVEILINTNHIILTDVSSNVTRVAELLKNVDSPESGMIVGQYVAQVGSIDALMNMAQQIMGPIAQDQPLFFVPHAGANSVFVVASPFLVEKTLSIMRHLDRNQGVTRMYNLKDLKLIDEKAKREAREGWELDENGNWIYKTDRSDLTPPGGEWYIDENGNWIFVPDGVAPPPGLRRGDGPNGRWRQDADGRWIFDLAPGARISAEQVTRPVDIEPDLPVGHIERTKFLIHKLQFRPGDQIQKALQSIGESLEQSGQSNEELISTINSTQWIETSNSLVFTGTTKTLAKMEELIYEIDTPLRQVFIEMLILNTTLDDSLEYGVNAATQFRNDNSAGAQVFISDSTSPITQEVGATTTQATALPATTLPGVGGVPGALAPVTTTTTSTRPNFGEDASVLTGARGYNLGIVGSVLTRGNERFTNIAALVRAIRDKTDARVVMNPKIIVEDGVEAEIFVGINTRFQSDSIANDFGTTITSNFEYQDVGTTLKVTPYLGHNDIVVLDIEQTQSAVLPVQTEDPQARQQQANAPTTSQSRTITRAHVPDRNFLIISGMMKDEETTQKIHIPCLGGIPMIGAGFGNRLKTVANRNIMIFIRPQIIDTAEQVRNVTRHQQNIWRYKNARKDDWQYETEEMLDFMNLTEKDPCDPCQTEY